MVSMASKWVWWFFLIVLLIITTFGLWVCYLVLLSILFTLIGSLLMINSGTKYPVSVKFRKMFTEKQERVHFGDIPKNVFNISMSSDSSKFDQRLTGSNEIDNQLREILSNIVRDFIQSWYVDVSANEDFLDSFNEMCKCVINDFSIRSKEVNWVSFLTHKVVENFTSHLRLFRHAELAYRKKHREDADCDVTMESIFFNKETDYEKDICRQNVCSSPDSEKEYIQCICDVILYILLPPEDFSNKILKHFLREVLSSSVLLPVLSQLSDPDVINQNLIWLCKDHLVASKSLLNIIRRTDDPEELLAFMQITKHELKIQNSKDTGDKDAEIKKIMKSIAFVQSVAHQRFDRLMGQSKSSETDSAEFYLEFDSTDSPNFQKYERLVSLPFNVILTNNIALHYFTQYLMNVNAEGYVFFYHNIECFKTTVESMKAEALINKDKLSSDKPMSEKLQLIATQLYDVYFSQNATSKINLDEILVRKLASRLKTEEITENFFEEVQEKVYDILETEYYLNGFKDSKMYVKLLAELDMLHDFGANSDLDSLSSSRSEEEEKFNCDTVVPTDEEMLDELLHAEIPSEIEFPEMSSGPISDEAKELGVFFAEVHSTGITHHAGRTFAVYAISVSHFRMDSSEEKWFVVKRYSEFYDFHEAVIAKFPLLSSSNFPAKKPFNNMTRQFMEKRRSMLNEFLQVLLSQEILEMCDGLKPMVYNFLQPNPTEKGKKSLVKKVGTFVNPLKTSVRTVGQFAKLVPDAFLELKDGLVKSLTLKKNDVEVGGVCEESLTSPKDTKADEIPFRIMLLLMDEVFNLRNKDLWFRRRIMALLRQIIKTMQGGAINRKIKTYVQGLTSATQIAEWLKTLSKSVWPDGKLAAPAPERDHNTKMRTRIVAKMLLFCAIPDELKHIIGYETSFRGAMLVFNMFQYPSLNRRLLLVMFESFLKALFPNHKLPELFQKFHSLSTNQVADRSASMDKINDQPIPKEPQKSPKPEIKVSVPDVLPPEKPKESKSNFFLSRGSQPNLLSSPKVKKRKKSVESAIFYTDLSNDDDTVILPLSR